MKVLREWLASLWRLIEAVTGLNLSGWEAFNCLKPLLWTTWSYQAVGCLHLIMAAFTSRSPSALLYHFIPVKKSVKCPRNEGKRDERQNIISCSVIPRSIVNRPPAWFIARGLVFVLYRVSLETLFDIVQDFTLKKKGLLSRTLFLYSILSGVYHFVLLKRRGHLCYEK